MNTENTLYNPYSDQFAESNSSESKSNLGAKIAAGAAAGIALGTAGAFAANAVTNSEGDREIALPDVEENIGGTDTDTVAQATCVDDSMSFGEAFAAARAEVGTGGVFFWRGGAYGTFIEEEWNAMTPAEIEAWRDNIDYSPMAEYHSSDAHSHHPHASTDHAALVEEYTEATADDIVEVDVNETPQLEGANVIESGYTDTGEAYAVVEKDGEVYGVVDTDNDNIYDTALHDANNDGHIDSNEYYDIADQELIVKSADTAPADLAEPEYELADDEYAYVDDFSAYDDDNLSEYDEV
ncbi:MAG: hypothetical protein K2N91_05690, partial [Muribaculaceae bacterium]|nr:hypothetical protein [Muribaculaceae bacterium]